MLWLYVAKVNPPFVVVSTVYSSTALPDGLPLSTVGQANVIVCPSRIVPVIVAVPDNPAGSAELARGNVPIVVRTYIGLAGMD